MTKRRTYTTPSGRKLIDDEIERLADEVASTNYDVDQIRRCRRP